MKLTFIKLILLINIIRYSINNPTLFIENVKLICDNELGLFQFKIYAEYSGYIASSMINNAINITMSENIILDKNCQINYLKDGKALFTCSVENYKGDNYVDLKLTLNKNNEEINFDNGDYIFQSMICKKVHIIYLEEIYDTKCKNNDFDYIYYEYKIKVSKGNIKLDSYSYENLRPISTKGYYYNNDCYFVEEGNNSFFSCSIEKDKFINDSLYYNKNYEYQFRYKIKNIIRIKRKKRF
jgi:hypothetical protein